MADTPGGTSESPKHPELAADAPIRLQVGGVNFTTTKDTPVEESEFFASLLSGRWDNAVEDGSYFIDADPVLFISAVAFFPYSSTCQRDTTTLFTRDDR